MGAHSAAEEVFAYLRGRWEIHRRFEGSYTGVFTGEACIEPQAPEPGDVATCLYRESGQLVDGAGKRFDARQSYLYQLVDGRLRVLKREMPESIGWEPMHELEFSAEEKSRIARHVHLCGQDHYETIYRVDLSGGWELGYEVSGPKKDYRIRTVYTRSARLASA